MCLLILGGFAGFITFESEVVNATTIYVGTGAGNDTTSIQDAIDNFANPGDTVFVFSGTYIENVIVNKTINLTGENPLTTIIQGDNSGSVVRIDADWVNITRFKLLGSGFETEAGIGLFNVQNCIINDNNMSSNAYGVYLKSSSNNIVTGNDDSTTVGIHLEFSDNNTIIDNIITPFDRRFGIRVWYSSNNTLIGNDIAPGGVDIEGDQLSHYTHNIPPTNMINGEPLYYYEDENGFDIDGIPIGQLILANCTDFDVRNLHINNTIVAMLVAFSANINITGNNFSNNDIGIYIRNSSWNIITNNNVSNDKLGIGIIFSSNNIILENTLLSNGYGIDLIITSNNTITGNNMVYCDYGIHVSLSTNTNIAGNTISMSIFIGIFLQSSSYNNTIKNNNISLNERGIVFRDSDNNIIKDNNVFSNYLRGIMLYETSSDNYITNNNISNNEYGIYLESSSNNRIYHNNIINNTDQAYDDRSNNSWNDTYPSGGNYWSDYIGVDLKRGPNQDIPGSDGFGDTPYTNIQGIVGNQDNYPLMKPNENYIILYPGWNLISIPFIQEDQNLSNVLERIDGYYDTVQWYDISDINDPWKHYKVGKIFGNDLSFLNETMGLWIHNNQSEDVMFLYNGTLPTVNQSISLHIGWNHVGYPSLTIHNRTNGLNTLEFGKDVDCIQWYDSSTKTWHFMGPEDVFVPGRGYWIHSKVEKDWEVPV
jgi:parallel beta-helix repeat protein